MEAPSSGLRNWVAVVIGVLIVAGVAAYFAGGAIEHSARARDAAAAEQKYTAVKTQLASVQSANKLLTANVWAYRATVALDNRNFGLANDAMANVVASLNGVDAAAAGLDSAALKEIQTEAAGVKIAVATNLEAQRSQLVRLAADITALSGVQRPRPG
jgi:hypothetical protein